MTAQSVSPTLAVKTREKFGHQVKSLRREGLIPAVLYGNHHEPQSLAVDFTEMTKVYREAGHSTLVALKIGDESAKKVLIHDIQTNALRHEITHVDFFEVNLKEKLRTEVPLVFEGVSDAVEILGGSLIHVKDAVEIECLPGDLISEIVVDISVLKTFEDTLTVADLKVPEAVVIMDEMDQTLISIAEPRSEAELEALDEAPVAAIETEFETEDGKVETPAEEGEKKEDAE